MVRRMTRLVKHCRRVRPGFPEGLALADQSLYLAQRLLAYQAALLRARPALDTRPSSSDCRPAQDHHGGGTRFWPLYVPGGTLHAPPVYNRWETTEGLSAERGRVLDERAAIVRAQQGDPEAFGSLVRRYEEVAFRVAYLTLRDEAEAQDVAQEAFVRAYRALGRFDTRQPLRPWLLRIVTNLAMNSQRNSRRRDAMSQRYERDYELESRTPSPEETVLAEEQAQLVWQAVGVLRPEEQTLLYLRYFLGASEKEAAVAIGRPVGTVKSRLHRALRRLRDVIEERYPELAPPAQAQSVGRAEG